MTTNERALFSLGKISKRTKIGLILIFSCLLGIYTAFISHGINRYLDFSIATTVYTYLLYIVLFGYLKRVEKVIHGNYKKIVSTKVFFFWLTSWFALFGLGAIFILTFHLQAFVIYWIFSIFAIVFVYSCTVSLAVYIPLFQYLDSTKNEREKRKSVANDLVVLTVGLGAPWLLLVLFVTFFISPTWINYLIGIIIVYIPTFFIAIDYPYYRAAEKEKEIKISQLKNDKKGLLKKLAQLSFGDRSEMGFSEKIAIELNIERIDREISEVKSETSHPYSALKSIVGFVIVSILANVFVQVILKLVFQIG
jgi:hypothetical protein